MKTLIIYTNQNSQNIEHDDFDIISNLALKTINDLYYECPKTYCYYLFLDKIIDLQYQQLQHIIQTLKTQKPAIYEIAFNIKIYHRSVIHLVYPLLKYQKYGNYIYTIQEIIEEPLQKFKLSEFITTITNKNNNKNIIQKTVWNNLINWFQPCIIKRYINYDSYTILKDPIETINFLNTFNIFEYFNTEHKYFKIKSVIFHKGYKEMYGQCTLHHFRHNFTKIGRNSIINHLISKFDYKKYLEIGVYNCYHFHDVKIEEKWGVDPSPDKKSDVYQHYKNRIHHLSSLDFFKQLHKDEKYDIIFIDGCLYEYNVFNDVEKSLEHLNPGGTIVLHDCNPPHEFLQRDRYDTRYYGRYKNNVVWNNRTYTDRHWNGKAWKVISKLRATRKDLEIYTVDADWGIGIIRKSNQPQSLFTMVTGPTLEDYNTLVKYRKYMLNLISPKKFLELFP